MASSSSTKLVQQLMERPRRKPGTSRLRARRRASAPSGGGSGEGEPGQATFEVTDKALDFLGYRALRDLLGLIGHASAGRHDTRDMATGVDDASGAPKPYEFGDTLNSASPAPRC